MASKPSVVRYTGQALFSDRYQLKRAQSFNSTTDFNAENLLELANSGAAEIIDDPNVTASLETNDYGGIDNFILVLGQGFYDGTANPARVFTETDFDNAIVDFGVQIASDDTTLERTIWLGGMFLTGLTLTYTVDGISTESFDFEGDQKRHFLNAFKDAQIYKGDYSSSSQAIISGVNLQTIGGMPTIPILLTKNQEIVAQDRDGDTITLTDNGSDTLVTATTSAGNSITFASGDRVRLVISGSGSTFPSLPETTAGLGGVRRGMVEAYLWNPNSGNFEKTLRLQSVTVTADLSREEKNELGRKSAYFRSLSKPLDITVSVEAVASDLEELAKLSGNESGFDAGTLNEIDVVEDLLKTNQVEVIVYNSETNRTFSTELKRLVLKNLGPNSEGDTISVGEDGTVSLELLGTSLIISGSGVNPIT